MHEFLATNHDDSGGAHTPWLTASFVTDGFVMQVRHIGTHSVMEEHLRLDGFGHSSVASELRRSY